MVSAQELPAHFHAGIDWPTRPFSIDDLNGKVGELAVSSPQRDAPTVCLIGGTRPEALKLGPVASALRECGRISPLIVASGQHPTMFHQGLAAFHLRPDVTVELSRTLGGQPELMSSLLMQLDAVFAEHRPSAVVVQGDTSTTLAAALTGFWHGVPVVHLEAGLRSGDLDSPFPEEGNRKLVSQISSLHLAPTRRAAQNLAMDGIPTGTVIITGNTIVDAALALSRSRTGYSDGTLADIEQRVVSAGRQLVLVTVHRRESWGRPLRRILRAVDDVVDAVPDVEVVLPAHPNPQVRDEVWGVLGESDRVTITEPLPYVDLVRLMRRSALVMSDSGGIQEEVASFGVPVLVLREVTERIEAVEAGFAVLVGTDRQAISTAATDALTQQTGQELASAAAAGNPFGDGRARYRAEHAIAWQLGLEDEPPAPFDPPATTTPAR